MGSEGLLAMFALLQGFLPTVLEDVPDMAVKFAVYETMRAVHRRMRGDRPAHTLEDLVMGGVAGGWLGGVQAY